MSQLISSLMERRVWSVGFEDTVESIEAQMAAQGVSWVPVRESNGLVLGVISASDVLRFHANKQDASKVCAWQLCSYKPVTVSPDATVSEVASLMVEKSIHHVIVMEGADIKGVVSSLDFVRTFISSP